MAKRSAPASRRLTSQVSLAEPGSSLLPRFRTTAASTEVLYGPGRTDWFGVYARMTKLKAPLPSDLCAGATSAT
jgi:hypothetical protein